MKLTYCRMVSALVLGLSFNSNNLISIEEGMPSEFGIVCLFSGCYSHFCLFCSCERIAQGKRSDTLGIIVLSLVRSARATALLLKY